MLNRKRAVEYVARAITALTPGKYTLILPTRRMFHWAIQFLQANSGKDLWYEKRGDEHQGNVALRPETNGHLHGREENLGGKSYGISLA